VEVSEGFMTRKEVSEFLNVSRQRVYQLRDAGLIKALKGGVYDAESVRAYKIKRGDRKGGPYERGKK
jgi:hypothetical protein